jgi:hypothetical protein
MKVHWLGALSAFVTVVLSLAPWVHFARQHTEVLPVQEGFLGWGLVTVYPLARGVLYWLRYPSLFFGRQLTRLDFTPLLGGGLDAVLTPLMTALTRYLGPLTVIVTLAANVRLWRRGLRALFRRRSTSFSGRAWLKGAVRWYFIAAVLSFAMSPTTIMMWQGLIIMHASVILVVLYLGVRFRRAAQGWARIGSVAWVVVIDARSPPHAGPELEDCSHAAHPGVIHLFRAEPSYPEDAGQ